jgi:hypothetical protein
VYRLSAKNIARDVNCFLFFFLDLPIIAFKIIHGCC